MDNEDVIDWESLTERERQHILEDRFEEYLGECSPTERARIEWENGS